MLRMASVSKPFSGEAVNITCHLINRSPSVALGFDIRERVWTEKGISYKYLRVFGCKAFIHILKEERPELDSKTIPCIFVSYGD